MTVIDITEPTAVDAGIELVDQEAMPLQPLPLRARRIIVRLGAATVMFQSTNRRMRTSTRVHTGLIAYVAFGPQATGTLNGVPVRPELILAADARSEGRFVVEPGWESITILMAPEEVRGHLAARGREHEFRAPQGIESLQADPDGARKLFDWGKRLAITASRQPVIFNDGKKERIAAQVELLEVLLSVLRGSENVETTRVERTQRAHSDIVAVVEKHAVSEADDHLSVTDLCRAAGVSERTLEYAFREIMGLTPVAYLTRVRLHRVRQALLTGTHQTTTVSREALNWGFWHFGEFARAYKACFGELPSDTLQRVPDGSLRKNGADISGV